MHMLAAPPGRTPATRPRAALFSSATEGGAAPLATPRSASAAADRPLFALSLPDFDGGGGGFGTAPGAVPDRFSQAGAALVTRGAVSDPVAADAPADVALSQRFALALEEWWVAQRAPPPVAGYLPLLEAYEALASAALDATERKLRAPDGGGGSRPALEAEAAALRAERQSWRLLLCLYAGFDGRQAAPPPFPPPPDDWGAMLRALGPAAAAAPFGPSGGGEEAPTLQQMAAAVSLLAQALSPDEKVVDGVASFLCQLPHDLPPAQKTLCFGEAARLLPPEQRPLLPHIALRAVTHRQSLPLPPPAQPAALAGALRDTLQCVRWLTVPSAAVPPAGEGGGGDADDAWRLVQALSQALLALRRAAAASSGHVELLVGTASGVRGALPSEETEALLDELGAHARAAAAADPLLGESLEPMLFELRFWSAALRAHAENAACLRALEGGGPAAAVVGAAARSLDAATREALTSVVMQYEGETMGRLPSVAEVEFIIHSHSVSTRT